MEIKRDMPERNSHKPLLRYTSHNKEKKSVKWRMLRGEKKNIGDIHSWTKSSKAIKALRCCKER